MNHLDGARPLPDRQQQQQQLQIVTPQRNMLRAPQSPARDTHLTLNLTIDLVSTVAPAQQTLVAIKSFLQHREWQCHQLPGIEGERGVYLSATRRFSVPQVGAAHNDSTHTRWDESTQGVRKQDQSDVIRCELVVGNGGGKLMLSITLCSYDDQSGRRISKLVSMTLESLAGGYKLPAESKRQVIDAKSWSGELVLSAHSE